MIEIYKRDITNSANVGYHVLHSVLMLLKSIFSVLNALYENKLEPLAFFFTQAHPTTTTILQLQNQRQKS